MLISVIISSIVCVTGKTSVVFTFDADNSETQLVGAKILESRMLRGTFFYSRIKSVSGGLSMNDYKYLYNRGHEIGGQTLNYIELFDVKARTAIDEVCYNRKDLLNNNLKPISYGYISSSSVVTDTYVKDCGYVLSTPLFPQKTNVGYNVNSVSLKNVTSLIKLQNATLNTLLSNTNGNYNVLIFRIYEMCDVCVRKGIEYAVFEEFLDWLSEIEVNVVTLKSAFNETRVLPLPLEYIDPPGMKLLPETESKMIIAFSTVGVMILFISLFFVSSAIRDSCG